MLELPSVAVISDELLQREWRKIDVHEHDRSARVTKLVSNLHVINSCRVTSNLCLVFGRQHSCLRPKDDINHMLLS